MEDERSKLLDRIGQLAGQINRHKNAQSSAPSRGGSSQSNASYHHHPYQRPSGRGPRGAYRGSRGRYAPYRSNSLTLNSSVPPVTDGLSQTATPGTPSYITRNDRHLQLINTSVYDRDSASRARSAEESKQQYLKEKNARENAKLRSYFKTQATVGYSADQSHHKQYTIDVNGVKFIVTNGGSKLVKADGIKERATPKMVLVGGVKFFRSKHGNLYRDAIVKAHRSHAHASKSTEPCKAFSTTGTCHKGPGCRFVHDFSKVAVCKEFLQKGTCPYGDNCDLSHDLKTQRTPSCLHYAKGNCANDDCRYAHSSASLGAPVCRPFGLYGYCDKGDACPERHSFECPDYTNTGRCNIKGCKLPHRERASVLRKQQERQENEDYSDLSSEDDDSDFDSEVEELFHDDNASEFDLDQDMISL